MRSGANHAHDPRIRSRRRRCASRESSRQACLRGIRRFRMGHCTRGVLPVQNPIRGARARRFDSVRVQTEVCRVCGLHPGRLGHRAESRANTGVDRHGQERRRCEPRCVPGSQVRTPAHKTAESENSMLALGYRRFAAGFRETGQRVRGNGDRGKGRPGAGLLAIGGRRRPKR
jgi:hypothetical protein